MMGSERFREELQVQQEKSYGTVCTDLVKQEYQNGNQNELTKSDSDVRDNVYDRNMDAKEKRQRQTASVLNEVLQMNTENRMGANDHE